MPEAARLRWSSNITAQREADAAFAALRDKPKPGKRRHKKQRRGRKRKQRAMKTPEAKPDDYVDREFAKLVKSF